MKVSFNAHCIIELVRRSDTAYINDHYPITGDMITKMLSSDKFNIEIVPNYLGNQFEPMIIFTEKKE